MVRARISIKYVIKFIAYLTILEYVTQFVENTKESIR